MQTADVTCYGCQHITGQDTRGFLTFCEAPVKPGSSYCPDHYGRKYIKLADYQAEPYHVRVDVESVVIDNGARLNRDSGIQRGLQVIESVGPSLVSGTDKLSATMQVMEK